MAKLVWILVPLRPEPAGCSPFRLQGEWYRRQHGRAGDNPPESEQATRTSCQGPGGSRAGFPSYRHFIGNALYVAQAAGAAMLALGSPFGIYVGSIALVASIAYTTTGAWLLLMGVRPPSE
jgi:hypothetical protein